MHEFVAHDLSEVVARVQAARYLGGGAEELERVEQAGVRSLESLEATVRALRIDGVPEGAGRDLEALPGLVERFNGTPGPRAVLVAPEVVEPSAEGAALVYRMVTECLTNLRKHAADAQEVRITIRSEGEGVVVTVADDGSAATATGSEGGLRMLTEWAEALRGTLTAGPSAGGWRVELVVPR
ncbi:sensor histidine kinase [Kribbella sp. NPDC050469]|uniref:sensor histidine kinase n=1 Tax=Kribbella sp. NPDC050469 TaxID=3364116 RepID=UPI00378F0129